MKNYIYERLLYKNNNTFKFCRIIYFVSSIMWLILCFIFSSKARSLLEFFNFLTLLMLFNCIVYFLLGRYYLNLPKTPYLTITDSEILMHAGFTKADRVISMRNIKEVRVGDKKIYLSLNNTHKEIIILRNYLYADDIKKLINILSSYGINIM